ncbi:MAG: adenosylcobinamide-GDP ribazoletransferase [Oscillospiraceae bacterium]|nr:adenosylcobinamide-GDP ribazoletransferase [Oscillospiraceae bacterium]
MKTVFNSIFMAFSMFSALPVPMTEWKKENMKYMLCALPLVGLTITAALLLWYWICTALDMGVFMYAAGVTLIPLAVSGGIHMDGFCDTVDALSSRAPAEKKREILKDPRAGAFAIIFTAAYFVARFALCTELEPDISAILFAGLIHTAARAEGAFAGLLFPASGSGGLLFSFKDAAAAPAAAIIAVWLVLCAAAALILAPMGGTLCIILSALLLWRIRVMSQREFGGMSGDIAGYTISLGELVLLFVYILSEKAVAICF